MKSKKYLQEILHYLYSERDKVEAAGYEVDRDLIKTYRFINEEIQNLQMTLFEDEYHQFSERLIDLFDGRAPLQERQEDDVV